MASLLPESLNQRVTMLVKDAREAARCWVAENAGATSDFVGAVFHGSINWLPNHAEMAATSDVDLLLVIAGDVPPAKLGKFLYRGVLLEVSYLSVEEVRSPEQVLALHHLAASFRSTALILDPTGCLTRLAAVVDQEYHRRSRVNQRVESASRKVLHGLKLDEAAPWRSQVNAWLFPAGITTHVLLAAGMRNPTVRRRYVAVRQLLREFGHSDFYPDLLALLGSVELSSADVEAHLANLAQAFDAACQQLRSPFPFAADITQHARHVAIDGAREMIEEGDHREAVFWMVATYSRCQEIFCADAATELHRRYDIGYQLLLRDLGITCLADLRRRQNQVAGLLPRVQAVAEAIMTVHPEIED